MNSYWAAYYGDAIVLSEEEMEGFASRYLEANKMEKKDLILDWGKASGLDEEKALEMLEDLEEDGWMYTGLSLREIPFRNSNGGGFFYLTDILTDDCEGMYLIHHVDEGKPNSYVSEKDAEEKGICPHPVKTASFSENCYVLFSDRNRMGPNAFGTSPYASYEELKQEFQQKLSGYLPEDFDWDGHIGVFSYAAYA